VDNDDDAQNGDVVAVIDGRTNCNKLWWVISSLNLSS
jgi:hypothetical protein